MNETQIAEKLKQNIPGPEPQVATYSTPEEPNDTGFVNDMGDNTDMYKLYDFFNVENNYRTGENEQKLQTIYRWAANLAQSSDYLAVANVISSHLQGIGAIGLGVTNLQKMYHYVKIEQQVQSLKQEQGLIHG